MNPGTIDWSAHEHAYGPATDVPELLSQLAHKDSAVRRKAFDKLANRINHQGWGSTVARHVVPFLIEALRSAKTPGDKVRLLVLLGELAPGGNHQSFLAAGYGSAYGSLSLREPLDPELRKAVLDGSRAYVSLLDDKSAPVRAAAAFLLGLLGPEPSHFEPLRERAAVEKDAAVLASLLLSLGLLSQSLKDEAPKSLLLSKLSASDALVRVAAASALAWASPHEVSPSTLLDLAEVGVQSKDVPFFDGKLSQLALVLAGNLLVVTGDFEPVDRLIALNRRFCTDVLSTLASALLGSNEEVPKEPKHRGQLKESELAFLRKVVDADLTNALRLPLLTSGLMPFTPALRQLLHPRKDAVLERLVDGEPLWKHAWRTLDGLSDFEAWRGALASLPTNEEREQALIELARLPYLIWLRWETQSPRWEPIADLILETARAERITPNLSRWVETASPKVAATVLGNLLPEQERPAWVRAHQDLLVSSASNLPRHSLPIVRELDLEDRERLVLSLPRLPALVLAETAPTPAVAEAVVDSAELAATHFFRDVTEGDWRKVLSSFGAEALPAFEGAARDKDNPIRELFAEAVARIQSLST